MSEPGELDERATALAPQVAERLEEVRHRIRAAGGDPGAVRVVAVTKTFGPEAALAALHAGIVDIGENYAGELLSKAAAVPGATWHYIGSIQRNKIARLAPVVSWWQTVSRAVEARAIAERTEGRGPLVLIEVNLSNDPSRPGCHPVDLDRLAGEVRETGVHLAGLMGVAPLGGDERDAEAAFARLARSAARLGLAELSMGMSGDLEAAVRAGSTMVRVGTAIFGPRHHHAPR